jgi:hypothetical protein
MKVPTFFPVRFRWAILFFVLFLGAIGAPITHAQEPQRIEVLIRNFTYEVQGGSILPETPTVIVVRNTDAVTHGFTSPLLQEVDVQVEINRSVTFGRGIKGVHIEPGQVHFIPPRRGRFTFSCDLHPNMKGEALLLSIAAG